MKKRVREKIRKRMLDIDELLSVCMRLPGWHRWDPVFKYLQRKMRKLKRRWPRIYYQTFFWGDLS